MKGRRVAKRWYLAPSPELVKRKVPSEAVNVDWRLHWYLGGFHNGNGDR